MEQSTSATCPGLQGFCAACPVSQCLLENSAVHDKVAAAHSQLDQHPLP
jgi:hypothetical protein